MHSLEKHIKIKLYEKTVISLLAGVLHMFEYIMSVHWAKNRFYV